MKINRKELRGMILREIDFSRLVPTGRIGKGLARGAAVGAATWAGSKLAGMLFGAKRKNIDELLATSSQDAVTLYLALKGLGTKESDVEEVFGRRAGDIAALSGEYGRLLATAGEKDDLATWLEDDGMDVEAEIVRSGQGLSDFDPVFSEPDMSPGVPGPFVVSERYSMKLVKRIIREELIREARTSYPETARLEDLLGSKVAVRKLSDGGYKKETWSGAEGQSRKISSVIAGEIWKKTDKTELDAKLILALLIAMPVEGKALRERYKQRGYESLLDMLRVRVSPEKEKRSGKVVTKRKREIKKARKRAEAALGAAPTWEKKLEIYGKGPDNFPIFDGGMIPMMIKNSKLAFLMTVDSEALLKLKTKILGGANEDKPLGPPVDDLDESIIRVTRAELNRVLREEFSHLS